MNQQQDSAGGTLDYATPRNGAELSATARACNGPRLIACAILVFAGCVMVGGVMMTDAHLATANIITDENDWAKWGGATIATIGLLGFVLEFLRGWRR